jgi:hypothetical protein
LWGCWKTTPMAHHGTSFFGVPKPTDGDGIANASKWSRLDCNSHHLSPMVGANYHSVITGRAIEGSHGEIRERWCKALMIGAHKLPMLMISQCLNGGLLCFAIIHYMVPGV